MNVYIYLEYENIRKLRSFIKRRNNHERFEKILYKFDQGTYNAAIDETNYSKIEFTKKEHDELKLAFEVIPDYEGQIAAIATYGNWNRLMRQVTMWRAK
ncbi:hypothetical protein DSM106972_025570 [Dulcicalothrix desertica PCC 7102]|uniref:Uncharacterized protein n=1 Tax=Dulcicalothrix desertica PCC 7102 TaxID=232991 RepID=A0A433VMG5_9CYAN|nr:hypothetical protein [Dulcicalothrix desertica]RUT07296.1 hypothetical protein DSM106972_025570 [Dulcicalothrix desertica PCC 7102]TWH55504.1 hypothetical protein CAL7102_03648 [Dulcicalothrix desertica PCC 7102]